MQQARELADREAFSFLSDINSDQVDCTITYGELHREALAVAGWLSDRVSPGDRVLLLFPSGLDFIKAFIGCLYAGAVAVPAPLPDGFRAQSDRVDGILRDAAVSAVLTDEKNLPGIADWLTGQAGPEAVCGAVGDLGPADGAGEGQLPAVSRDSLALLQYTSGSTGEPKGVMITHGNLLDNLELIRQCVGGGPETRGCGWLPLIHDMGLMGQVLWIAYVGGRCLLMPPTEFLRRPYRWLELIDAHGIDSVAAPNFAYQLCNRTVTDERIAKLDLSRWKVAFNGAEPVLADTLATFAERFGPAGFRVETFVPCYGMAEATLFVCGTDKGVAPTVTTVDPAALAKGEFTAPADGASGRELVSSGTADPARIRIVDPQTEEAVPDSGVGEIWVRGGSVAQGYWQQTELNGRTFDRSMADEHGFLRTGDLGVVYEGQLYVTGRLKEVINVRGRNLYPQDLERTVSGLHERLTGAGAVFSLPEHSNAVVVVQEIKPRSLELDDFQEITDLIRRTLVREFSITVPSVVLVRPGSVRKTTSGKVRRTLMKDLFLQSSLTPIHEELSDGLRIR
ncbi:fatty acyl-AMP ligase [Streptomyces halobius]|uniref:Fatty acyl-AMP ligase n=1 Tax=Streptomyces halobius TaxID=2879846 RepID=A0ABY4M538_9ACTN|nr:fatty acyl-AMP ligase [Streptomyces halobius]UQA92492.1 fatty acyl-AMP ligase [Streptomyces halobius]